MLFMCMGLLRRKYLQKCCVFLILRLREFTWFHNWWLAKSWTPIVEQLFHNWSISLISSCPLWDTSLFWYCSTNGDWPNFGLLLWNSSSTVGVFDFDRCSTIGDLMFHKWGGKLFHNGIWHFFFFLIEIIFFSYFGMIRVNQSYVNFWQPVIRSFWHWF